ncbi:MAG: hypothetical protein RUDDFDWM_001165, partial [Candidatus Fervidibacterota bacterium]
MFQRKMSRREFIADAMAFGALAAGSTLFAGEQKLAKRMLGRTKLEVT